MEKVILNVDIRDAFGKEANKKLRSTGAIPAIVYKKGGESMPLIADAKELFRALHTSAGSNVIITLDIKADKKQGKVDKEKTVIIKEVQYDPIKDDILHVDFHEISLTEKIEVNISIETKGEPEGVKSDGGILDHPLKELHVECLPTNIPEQIYVHVDKLKIGDAIRVKDLDIPQGITVLSDPEQTVVSVVPPKAEEELVEGAAEGIDEPEVIREKKPEAEGDSGAEPVAEKKQDKKEQK